MLARPVDLLEIWDQRLLADIFGLLLEHLGVADDGVQRRPQLVGHVGQEGGLVLAGLAKLAFASWSCREQPGVLDGDDGLIRERLQQGDLPLVNGRNSVNCMMMVPMTCRPAAAARRAPSEGRVRGSASAWLGYSRSATSAMSSITERPSAEDHADRSGVPGSIDESLTDGDWRDRPIGVEDRCSDVLVARRPGGSRVVRSAEASGALTDGVKDALHVRR